MTRRWFSFLILGGLLLAQGFALFTRGGYYRLYWIPTSLLLGLLTAACLLAWNHRWLKPGFNLKTDLPLLGFLGWAALSLLFSVNREETLFEVIRLATLAMVYFMVRYALPEAPEKKALAFGLVGLGLAEAVYGLVVFISEKPLLHLGWLELPAPGAYVTGTFLNHNHFAGLMGMAVCLGFGLITSVPPGRDRGEARSERIFKRLFLAIPCAVMLLGLVLSASRGGWASFLIAIPFFLALFWWNAHPSWSRVIAVAMAMVLLALVFILGVNREPLLRRIETLEAFYRQPEEMTTDGRVSLWKSSLAMVRDHPWTGTGWGTYGSVYPAYREGNGVWGDNFAHNDYLQIAAGMGLPGLGLFLLFLAMIFWGGFRKIASQTGDFRALALPGILAGLFVVLVHEAADFNLMQPSNLMFFFCLAGLAAGPGAETAVEASPRRTRQIALDALILFALPLFLVRNAQLFQAESSFRQAERLSEDDNEDAAFAAFQRAAEIAPGRAQYQRAVGRSGLRLYQARPQNLVPLYQARQAYERTLKLDAVYPYDRFEMGQVLEDLRSAGVPDLPDPEPYLQQAQAIDPTNPIFLSGLMTWQMRHGQPDQARRRLVQVAVSGPPAISLFGPSLLTTHEERVKFAEELGRHPAANLEYAQYLVKVKDLDLARQQAALARGLVRQHPETALQLSRTLVALGDTDQAEQVLAQALAADPKSLSLAQAWARLRLGRKDLPGAIAVYQQALRLNPKAWQLNLALAQLYQQAGQDHLALDQFETVLETHQADARQRKAIYAALGEIKLKQGNPRGALVEFQKALELAPNDPQLDQKIKRLQVELEYQGRSKTTP